MLTQTQLLALRAHILASTDPNVVAARAIRNDVLLAELYNAPTPFVAWRSTLSPQTARAAIVGGAQLAQIDNLTAGKREALFYALADELDVTTAAVRDAIGDLCGTQTALKAALLAAMKRTLTVAERVFATGTGTDATPGTLGWEGTLAHPDISAALNLVV